MHPIFCYISGLAPRSRSSSTVPSVVSNLVLLDARCNAVHPFVFWRSILPLFFLKYFSRRLIDEGFALIPIVNLCIRTNPVDLILFKHLYSLLGSGEAIVLLFTAPESLLNNGKNH